MVRHSARLPQGRPQVADPLPPALVLEGTPPPVGTPAPDFALRDQYGAPWSLVGVRGRALVLVFFPFAFTPTCADELAALREEQEAFAADGVAIAAVSCDPAPALKAFAAAQGIDYPLLSDFWPHGAVSRAYGVFLPDRGMAVRGSFVLDPAGRVVWSVINDPAHARSIADYRAALAAARPVGPAGPG